jgi:hypothetical protein
MRGIGSQRPGWTSTQARRLHTLPTLGNNHIIGEITQVIMHDLDSRERQTRLTVMNQGTRDHAIQATLTFLRIDE